MVTDRKLKHKAAGSNVASRFSLNLSYRSSGGNQVYYHNNGGDCCGDDRHEGYPRRYEGYHRDRRGYRSKGGRGYDRRPDDHHGRDRERHDDRYHNDRHRDDKKGLDARHVDERGRYSSRLRSRSHGRGRSRSSTSSRGRSPSRDRSRSHSRDSRHDHVDTYHVDLVDAPVRKDPPEEDRKPAAKKIKTGSDSSSSSKSSKPGPRYRIERNRCPIRYTEAGKPIGFGSFYKRPFGDYSPEEFGAKQGDWNRVRTIDLLYKDVKKRINSVDDSDEPSNWYDRCKVEPPKRGFNHFD